MKDPSPTLSELSMIKWVVKFCSMVLYYLPFHGAVFWLQCFFHLAAVHQALPSPMLDISTTARLDESVFNLSRLRHIISVYV